jgi:hypothetical protein
MPENRHLCYEFAASIFIAVLLVGCVRPVGNTDASEIPTAGPAVDFGDGGFLSGEPCGPPCFLDITPGVTEERQAIEILQGYIDIQECDRWDWSEEGGVRGIGCPHVIGYQLYTVAMDFSDQGLVTRVGFIPSQMITVEAVIAKYGIPDWLSVVSWTEEGESPPMIFMALYYSELRTRIVLPIQETDTYLVSPTSQIESVTYEGISLSFIVGLDLTWQGYGEYPVSVP